VDFDESVTYLLGLGHETVAIKLGLENIRRLLAHLGHPERAFPSVQLAGTNGKGSAAAMLAAVCRAAGVRAGLYTSPHLVSITERVRLDGREISREAFARAATEVRAAAKEVRRESGALPTFFEQVTAAALVAFREARVELAILETGLGGRLDATTAAGATLVAVTPVALDHQEYLGATLAEIAAEKAAVIRPGVRAVVAPQWPEAEAVIGARAAACGVGPRRADERWFTFEGLCEGGRLRARVRTGRRDYGSVCLALRGRHQLTNAAVAVGLAEALLDEGFPVTPAAVVAGLEAAEHAGRLELDESVDPHVLLDGAHNPAGARALRAYLDEFVSAPLTLVFGAMRDKALAEIGALLFPAARHLILTEPRSPRAAAAGELLRAVPTPAGSSTITLAPSSADALAIARAQARDGGLVCVTGSLYLVGEVKQLLGGEGDC
jgi:dihydrofolate synthase/folylpolyglutamate synthase